MKPGAVSIFGRLKVQRCVVIMWPRVPSGLKIHTVSAVQTWLSKWTAVPGGSGSTLGSFGRASGALGLDSSAAARRLSPVAVALLRSGLLVLDTRVSLVVTCTLSVLLSSTARLAGRGLPEAVRLCAVETLEGCGDGLSCLLGSDLSALKLSRPLAGSLDGRSGFSCAAVPFTPNPESLAEEDDIVFACLSASVVPLPPFLRRRKEDCT